MVSLYDLIFLYLCGVFVVYMLLKADIEKASPIDTGVYYVIVAASWISLSLFVVLYLVGFVVGFIKQLHN